MFAPKAALDHALSRHRCAASRRLLSLMAFSLSPRTCVFARQRTLFQRAANRQKNGMAKQQHGALKSRFRAFMAWFANRARTRRGALLRVLKRRRCLDGNMVGVAAWRCAGQRIWART